MSKKCFKYLLITPYIMFVILSQSIYAGSFTTVDGRCTTATPLQLNSTQRDFDTGTPKVFQLEVTSSGVITLDVAGTAPSPTEAMLGLLGPSCSGGSAGTDVWVIARSATSLVLWVDTPAIYAFIVASQDPSQPLGDYKLRNSFAADQELIPAYLKSGDDPIKVDPETFYEECGGQGLLGGPVVNKSGDDPIEVDPETLAGGCSGGLRFVIAETCRRGEVDDHGDTLACASRLQLGQAERAMIRNDWRDDHDVFMFVLTGSKRNELLTVRIEASGGTDTFGTLYDRYGHRLESNDDDGDNYNFRIVKTLRPGPYFVRVEGRDQAEGAYSLRVEATVR